MKTESISVEIYLLLTLCTIINCSTNGNVTTNYFYEENLPDYVYDYDYILPSDIALNITVNKCKCDYHQLWDESSGCFNYSGSGNISDYYVDLNPYFQYSINLSKNFHHGGFICDGEVVSVKSKIEESKIFISEISGDVYYQEAELVLPSSKYCIELYNDQNVVEIEAVLCLPPFNIPTCCKNKSNCLSDFSNPVNIGSYQSIATGDQFSEFKKKECSSKDLETKIILPQDSKSVEFHYNSGFTSLRWTPGNYYSKTEVFLPTDYCISQGDNSTQVINLCYEDALIKHKKKCAESTCVRKCCDSHKSYDILNRKCSSELDRSGLSSLINFYQIGTKNPVEIPDNLIIEYNFPWCSNGSYLIDPQMSQDEFYLLENGSLYVSLSDIVLSTTQYCIDDFFMGNISSAKAIACFLESKNQPNLCKISDDIFYPILLVISSIFLFLTLIVYASIQELHTKLHGKSLISHVSSLLGAFFCQLIISWNAKNLSMLFCKLIGLANQLTFLWAFFWLNVMCFDIWWTLKTMSPGPETGENTRKRFVNYSIYAWGTPVLIVILTAIMQFLPSSVDKTGLILPGFGVRGCWFQDRTSTWVYFHGFTLLLFTTNILFFLHVAVILVKEHRSTEGILRTTWKQQKERVLLYLKLFVVMGITWICEVASGQEGTCEYWILTDIFNSLQGVFIFFIFMCNKKVFQKMQAKGVPFFQSLKRFFKSPSRRIVATGSSSSRRTTQTSVESSSRRLSTSLQPPVNAFNKIKISLSRDDNKNTIEKKETVSV